jgi:hypothetical protein
MAKPRIINQALNGLNPLSYMGVRPITPQNFTLQGRAPTNNDYAEFDLGDLWLDVSNFEQSPPVAPTATDIYMLVAKIGGVATWVTFGTPPASTLTVTGNTGGAVSPDGSDNLGLIGDAVNVTIAGSPGAHSLTVSLTGFTQHGVTVGAATGKLSSLAVGTTNTVLLGNTGADPSFGQVPNAALVSSAITLANGNNITVTGSPVALGGTATIAVSGTTNHALLVGNVSGSISSLGVATDGQLPIGSTGANPVLATLTAGSGITITNGAGSITIAAGGGASQSFPTDSGTATPSAGVLNIKADSAGRNAGSSVSFTGSSNTVLLNVTDANGSTMIGNLAGSTTMSGSGNIALGKSAGSNITGAEVNNTLIGHAGITGTSGLLVLDANNEVIMHNYPGAASVNGRNIFVGGAAGNFSVTNTNNCALGGGALAAVTGPHNIAIGNIALANVTSGNGNVGVGHSTMSNPAVPSGLTTGNRNVAIGYTAGSNWTSSESDNIAISTVGLVGESAVTRIGGFFGGETFQTKCFIQGIRGVTTVTNDAIPVLIDSLGQLGTISSSIRFKENVQDMAEGSARVLELRPVTFTWKESTDNKTNLGLIAEEVHAVMPELVVYTKEGEPASVKYHDLPVLLLNEIKKMYARIQELEREIIRIKKTLH